MFMYIKMCVTLSKYIYRTEKWNVLENCSTDSDETYVN